MTICIVLLPLLSPISSLRIDFLNLRAGMSLVLNMILFTALKSASKRRIACNFDTNMMFRDFSNIIDTLYFHCRSGIVFCMDKFTSLYFAKDKSHSYAIILQYLK